MQTIKSFVMSSIKAQLVFQSYQPQLFSESATLEKVHVVTESTRNLEDARTKSAILAFI